MTLGIRTTIQNLCQLGMNIMYPDPSSQGDIIITCDVRNLIQELQTTRELQYMGVLMVVNA